MKSTYSSSFYCFSLDIFALCSFSEFVAGISQYAVADIDFPYGKTEPSYLCFIPASIWNTDYLNRELKMDASSKVSLSSFVLGFSVLNKEWGVKVPHLDV